MKRVLLDTGMLLGLMREAPWALKADADLSLSGSEALAFTSAVCRGELLALAEKRGWGARKRKQMESVLDRFPTIGINRPSILSAYALIDAWTHGKIVESPANTPPAETRSFHEAERSMDCCYGPRKSGCPRVHGRRLLASGRSVVRIRVRLAGSVPLICPRCVLR